MSLTWGWGVGRLLGKLKATGKEPNSLLGGHGLVRTIVPTKHGGKEEMEL